MIQSAQPFGHYLARYVEFKTWIANVVHPTQWEGERNTQSNQEFARRNTIEQLHAGRFARRGLKYDCC